MIEVNNITKRFFLPKSLKDSALHPFKKNKEILALDDVSLNLEKGEVLALLGPNGAGKTTLIKILCTLILPDHGTAKISGYDLVREGEQVKSKIGLIMSDERGFYWRLTGRQNLEFFAALYGFFDKVAREKTAYLQDILQIDDLDKPFQDYSTGMKHRLNMARCLLSDPEVIFMDEPTKSLDPAGAAKFRLFLKEVLVKKLGKTVFLATHQTHEAEILADKIAVMDKGKISAFGTLAELNLKNGLRENSGLEELYLKITEKQP